MPRPASQGHLEGLKKRSSVVVTAPALVTLEVTRERLAQIWLISSSLFGALLSKVLGCSGILSRRIIENTDNTEHMTRHISHNSIFILYCVDVKLSIVVRGHASTLYVHTLPFYAFRVTKPFPKV